MHKFLELHLAQLERAWDYSRTNVYSEPRKTKYHDNLNKLLGHLRSEEVQELDSWEILEIKKIIDFFFINLAYLNSSTLNNIPFEVTKCLETALSEWLDEGEFIIVPSLSQNFDDFYFDPTLISTLDYYEIIEVRYGLRFDTKLIQITMPRALASDYLAAVILYHELGHFIDVFYNISDKLEYQILTNPPIFEKLLKGGYLQKGLNYKRHCEEYFADVFAARYIGNSLANYLEYLTLDDPEISYEYPSFENRKRIVSDFLDKKNDNLILNLILDVFKKSVGSELIVINDSLQLKSYKSLLPEEIESPQKLHKIFPEIWKLWENSWRDISETNSFGFEVTSDFKYEVINNLTEKTISNHIISSSWKKINVSHKE